MRKIKDTAAEYHDNGALNRSSLFLMSKSPAHFKYSLENKEETEALRFGKLFHTFILEPECFDDRYVVVDIDRRTKEGKATALQIAESGRETVSTVELASLNEMKKSIFANKYASALLRGEKEISYYWQDEMTGIECKCRPDCITPIGDLNIIVDLKSCDNASTEEFMRAALRYGYDLQSAQYKTGVELVEGKPHKFVFIAVEKKPPYALNILEADEIFIRKGYDDFRTYLGILKYCRETDNWYSYTGETGRPNVLNLPAWLIKEYE
jgi:hypothetical protein